MGRVVFHIKNGTPTYFQNILCFPFPPEILVIDSIWGAGHFPHVICLEKWRTMGESRVQFLKQNFLLSATLVL